MAKNQITVYTCDSCGKSLGGPGSLNIVTSLSGENLLWSRLHVGIVKRSGMHNDATEEGADLCQKCAIVLLANAIRRIRAGERASKGAETSEQEGWKG
jgi:hypothetical protein